DRLQGLLVVGRPSGDKPYTVFRVDAPREDETSSGVVEETNLATVDRQTKSHEEASWQDRWLGREDQLPGLGPVAEGSVSGEVTGLGMALVLAFLGGLILNIMPCVFPVLGLK